MSARVAVVHDDARIRDDLVNALRCAGCDATGFSETRAALVAIEADERIELIITRVTFPEGTQNGVSLALMGRMKQRGMKVLFLARPQMVKYTSGVGEVLQTPVPATDVVAKVRAMLPLSD